MLIAGVVVLLFIAGVVPFSSLLLLLVVFFLFAGCIQYTAHAQSNTQHPISGVGANLPAWQNAQRIQRAAVLSMLGTFGLGNSDLRNIITDPAAGGSFHNLRLSMMNRDFTDAGETTLLLYMIQALSRTYNIPDQAHEPACITCDMICSIVNQAIKLSLNMHLFLCQS